MFCPGCGIEEKHSNQFCRACGTDLRIVRVSLERPDNVTASAVSAREEIGRAIAARIRETRSASELAKVTEEVLPEIEKFLESPAEKRLRRLRTGMILSSIGVGTAMAFFIAGFAMRKEELFIIAGLGIIAFFIGLSFALNGFYLTIPKEKLLDKSPDADRQRELDDDTNELVLPESRHLFTSVTEPTTRQLDKKERTAGK